MMIANEQEFQTTLERIAWFQKQAMHIRNTIKDPTNYRAAVSGFLAEIDRMQLEVRDYLSFLPESATTTDLDTAGSERAVGVR